MISTEALFRLVRGPVAIAEPLAPYTGIRTGGPADFLVKPKDRADMVKAHGYFNALGYPFFILGKGSSLLVNDQGFRGVVIATHLLDRITIDDDIVEADAGVSLPVLLEQTRYASLGGLEQLDNFPGSVGGVLRRAAGIEGKKVTDTLEWVDILRNGRIRRVKKRELTGAGDCRFTSETVILGAGFRLRRISSKEKRAAVLASRLSEQREMSRSPRAEGLAIRVFRSRENGSDAGLPSPDTMIDACGLRGRQLGGASVSLVDANTIVNTDEASSHDVFELVCLVRDAVQEKFGVSLPLDMTLVGYNRNGCDESFRA
jgi:UDP-N-acetylmuramate dehydrogenase